MLLNALRRHPLVFRKRPFAHPRYPGRRKLSALSSFFDYLCEHNAVVGNPVDGVKRPMANSNEGSTPALGDRQARKLLEAPPCDTLKGIRDKAILATLLYHGMRVPDSGVVLIEPDWAGKLSGFTLLFEALILTLCRQMPFAAVARLAGESWHRVQAICERYVELALVSLDCPSSPGWPLTRPPAGAATTI